MKLRLLSIGLFLCLVGCASQTTPSGSSTQPAPTINPMEPVNVMTFNLRYASPKPPHSWPERRPVLRDCIRQYAPDIIGTQEGVYYQVKDIAADLPEYEWIGLGRDGGSRGEFMAVFFRKDRFEPLAYDHYWLSDTPDVMCSSTWGNTCRRMVTWVKFLDRRSGREFYFMNTHFDHEVQTAREKSATLVLQRTLDLKTPLPVLLVGDFNADAANKAYQILTAESAFADTWTTAKKRINETTNTFHGYKSPTQESCRIDWILSRGPVAADSTEIVTFERNGQYPSDHFPMITKVRFEAP